MRGPIIRVALLAAALATAGCGPSKEEAARAEAEAVARQNAASARTDALRALHALEAAIAEARLAVSSGETASASRAQALHVSEIRRAIVVANVAVQKAREALSRGDYAAAKEAVGVAPARLRDVVSGRARPSGGEPPKSHR